MTNRREPSMASDPDKPQDEGCTACTPGQGCGGAGQSCGAEEVYGLYARAIREGVANCADYLDRIIRQLEGGAESPLRGREGADAAGCRRGAG
jgi:hypothetical protein